MTATATPTPSREYGWVALITGVLGLWASAALSVDYINRLTDENYVPGCDVNPMLGCGLFLDSPAAHTFGIPNIVVGVAAFPIVVTLAVLLVARVQLPVWVWRGLTVGTFVGIAFVTYLQYEAMFVLHGLCPWCLVVWVAMIPLFVHTVVSAGVVGALGERSFTQLYRNRWIIVALWYLIVIVLIAITLGADLIAAF